MGQIYCHMCGNPCYDELGHPIEKIYVYQNVDGRYRLAREIVLHKPLIHIHFQCLPEAP